VHDSNQFKERNKTISEDGYHNLCRTLESEIHIYLQVMQKATNLNDQDVKEAAEDIHGICGDSIEVSDLLYN
jgi:hypothetical protein